MRKNMLRRGRYAVLATAAMFIVGPALAQQTPMDPRAIGQIADEVLLKLLPPDERIDGISVARRPVFFDRQKTLVAFGYSSDHSAQAAGIHMQRSVRDGSADLLDRCDQWGGRRQCRSLGWGVYAWLEPLGLTQMSAHVRIHIRWAAREPNTFREGVAPDGHAILVGHSSDVYLERSSDGAWKYMKTGMRIIL